MIRKLFRRIGLIKYKEVDTEAYEYTMEYFEKYPWNILTSEDYETLFKGLYLHIISSKNVSHLCKLILPGVYAIAQIREEKNAK